MKRTAVALIALVMSLLLLASIALAVPGFYDRGNPNDPRVNDRANACYDGASLAGKCHTQVEWDAGWYLIRFEFGLLSRNDIPSAYDWILPAVETPESTPPPTPTPRPR